MFRNRDIHFITTAYMYNIISNYSSRQNVIYIVNKNLKFTSIPEQMNK